MVDMHLAGGGGDPGVRVRASSIFLSEEGPEMDDSGLWHDMFAFRYGLPACVRCCWCGGPHICLLEG